MSNYLYLVERYARAKHMRLVPTKGTFLGNPAYQLISSKGELIIEADLKTIHETNQAMRNARITKGYRTRCYSFH